MIDNFKVLFFLNKDGNSDTAHLRCRVRWCDNSVVLNLGHRVNPAKWSSEAQRCAARSYHGKALVSSSIINGAIDDYARKIAEFFDSSKETPTADDFRAYMRKGSRRSNTTIKAAIRRFIDEQSVISGWSANTLKKLRTMQNHIDGFGASYNDLETVTPEWMYNYLRWLTDTQGYNNVYVQREIKSVKWFLRWAKKAGIYQGEADTFAPKLRTPDKPVIFCTWEELGRIAALDLDGQRGRVRDAFLFLCFTGLRYSDLAKLKRADIHGDVIEVVTAKTVDNIRIDVNQYARAILDKYKDVTMKNDAPVPVYALQVMNRELKEIARAAKLDEPVTLVKFSGAERKETTVPKYSILTTHSGRRTFVCCSMYLGIPDAVIMSWTGHHSIAAMKPYRKVVDDAKRKEMEKFNSAPLPLVTRVVTK